MFSSIFDPSWWGLAPFAEMERNVRLQWRAIVYDFVIRKPTNPHVIGMPPEPIPHLHDRRLGASASALVLQGSSPMGLRCTLHWQMVAGYRSSHQGPRA